MVGCSTLGQVLGANPALAPLAAAPICPDPPPPVVHEAGED